MSAVKQSFSVSIIIPMLNEREQLPGLFENLLPFARCGCDVLFVDGGSEDGSKSMVEAVGFRLVSSAPGRAKQMNAGAAATQGDILLFLHADTRLPDNAVDCIASAIEEKKYVWGRFNVRIQGKSPWLKLIGFMMNLRSAVTGIATGDQAIFISRSAFVGIGGFPEQPLMEDIEFCKRLKNYPCACIKSMVLTSGRRWDERGVWKTIFLMWRLRWLYWRGASVEKIAEAYR